MGSAMAPFPDWIDDHIPDDQEFAGAFDSVSPQRRAWLKTAIARLFDWYGPAGAARSDSLLAWQSGLTARVRRGPRDFALLFLDGRQESPVRVLASIVPALVIGVSQVMVARVDGGGKWPQPVLAALELAGVETVIGIDSDGARNLAHELAESDQSGAFMGLGPDAVALIGDCGGKSPGIVSWFSDFGDRADIWLDSVDDFDLEAMSFAHPGTNFFVWGAESELPEGRFEFRPGTWDEFVAGCPDLAYVPVGRSGTGACVEYHPGDEGCWFWPELSPELFIFQNVGWGACVQD